jgi:cysteine desulfurase
MSGVPDNPKVIYMDHAATTPTDPCVVEAMTPYFGTLYGNASSLYSIGIKAEEAIDEARKTVARFIGARPEEIYFTSGGTESDNWAIQGVAWQNERRGKHIITSMIEHHAVHETAKFMERCGFKVTYVDVDEHGLVDPDDVKKALTPDTTIVSIMHANNEIGTIEPIAEIARVVKAAGVYFHTDAVQTYGKIPLNVDELGVDMLSVSGHKLYGPKGVGVLYVRKGTRIMSYMHGGGQERGRRAGTHNTPGIVGLAKATELAAGPERSAEAARATELAGRLRDGIFESVPDVRLNGHPERRLPGNLNICVEGIEGEAMLLCLDANGVCVSSGSACTTGSLEPSHVLLAIGLPAEVAHGSLRFSLGRENTREEVDFVCDVFPDIVKKLRAMSPTYTKAV